MASGGGPVAQLEVDLGNMSLDVTDTKINYLVGELEKLVVDSSAPSVQVDPPVQEKPVAPDQLQNEVLQQILAILKSPNSLERRQQITHILKNFPALLAAFIKQRQVFQRAQGSFIKKCETYRKALTGQAPPPAPISTQVRLRHPLAMYEGASPQPSVRCSSSNRDLMVRLVRAESRIRQLHSLRNNSPMRRAGANNPGTSLVSRRIAKLYPPEVLLWYRHHQVSSGTHPLQRRKSTSVAVRMSQCSCAMPQGYHRCVPDVLRNGSRMSLAERIRRDAEASQQGAASTQ